MGLDSACVWLVTWAMFYVTVAVETARGWRWACMLLASVGWLEGTRLLAECLSFFPALTVLSDQKRRGAAFLLCWFCVAAAEYRGGDELARIKEST